jgi:hypothetical protein
MLVNDINTEPSYRARVVIELRSDKRAAGKRFQSF